MSVHLWFLAVASLWVSLVSCQRLAAQEDVADITSQDLRADKDENKRYLLVGPRKDVTAPKKGFGLLVVLPGGDGTADFHPFVKRIYKNAVPEGYVLAQPVAVKWTEKQQIVWPTDKNRVEAMKFSTEAFVDAVIQDAGGRHPLDPERTFTLTWPDDRVCPFRMAEQAAKDLEKSGATVNLATYGGGHGWRAGLYDHIREGVQWLENNRATRDK